MTGADPLLAAVDHYRAAVRRRTVTERETWNYCEEGDDENEGLPQSHPYWVQKEKLFQEAFDGEWAALDALFETPPTTVVGIAALIELLSEDPYWTPDATYEKGANESVLPSAVTTRVPSASTRAMSTLAAALRAAGGGWP